MTEQKETHIKNSNIFSSKTGINDSKFNLALEDVFEESPHSKYSFSGFPVIVDKQYITDAEDLCKLLNDTLVKVAYNYFRDHRIQAFYQLDDELNQILSMAEGTPFELGMYRPNFVFDENGQAKICGIDCRYPSNGWVLSSYVNHLANNLLAEENKDWTSIKDQQKFIDEFSNRYDSEDAIFYISDKEKGVDIGYLKNELEMKGFHFKDVKIGDLELKENELTYQGEIARQFYLELDREELRQFDRNVLRKIITSGRCINDVRSIILMHDKRTLALLFNKEVMSSYLYEDDYYFLKRFLVPTYTLHTIQNREFLKTTGDNWMLKQNSGGQGTKIYIKDNCSKESWEKVLEEDWHNFMAQPVVAQKSFEVIIDGETEEVFLTGMNLYFNGQSFGPGVFKAQIDGQTLFPCLLENK